MWYFCLYKIISRFTFYVAFFSSENGKKYNQSKGTVPPVNFELSYWNYWSWNSIIKEAFTSCISSKEKLNKKTILKSFYERTTFIITSSVWFLQWTFPDLLYATSIDSLTMYSHRSSKISSSRKADSCSLVFIFFSVFLERYVAVKVYWFSKQHCLTLII